MKLSPYQEDICSEVANPQGAKNIAVKAVAGSGKTTTAIEAVLKMPGSVTMLAFNKKIAVAMGKKLSQKGIMNAKAYTFHGLGYNALRYHWKGDVTIAEEDNKNKKWERIASELGIPEYLHKFCEELVSHAKKRAFGIITSMHSQEAWIQIADHHDLYSEINNEKLQEADVSFSDAVKAGLKWAVEGLLRSNEIAKKFHIIDFDDMVYLPVLLPMNLYRVDWVVIDEAQDSNPVWRALVRKLLKAGGRTLWIGDPCQPEGTMITIPKQLGNRWHIKENTEIQIENLKIGDSLVSYCPKDGAYYGNRKVEGITKKDYSGEMIHIQAGEYSSKYTPNHHCWANFKPLQNKFVVYMMKRKNQFRIGCCKLDYKNLGNGLVRRVREEEAEGAWILEIHDTLKEARIRESQLGHKYNIPQLIWKTYGNPAYIMNQDGLDRFWDSVGDIEEIGIQALHDFGRLIQYPIVTGDKKCLESFKRPIVVNAANLLPGALMLDDKKNWTPIKISKENYKGEVYSLTVSHDHLYIADKLVTHNCQAINGFAGADNDAFDQVIKEFNCKEMPLTKSYRCSKASVRFVQQWVDYIEADDSCLEGYLDNIGWKAFLDKIFNPETDAIICRNTAPLVVAAYALIGKGVPCQIEGRKDLGEGLLKLVKKWKKPRNIQEFANKLDDYATKQVARYNAAGKEMLADNLMDKVNALFAIMNSLPGSADVKEIFRSVESIFCDSDEGKAKRLILCTGHKSKGLEWDNVYWIGRESLQPSKYARQRWQIDQEIHLMYVMGTRSKDGLIEVEMPPRKDQNEEKDEVMLEVAS